MVNLEPLFATARTLAAQAIETGGCEVRVETRTPGQNLGDPDTITPHDTYPALITPAGDTATPLVPGLVMRPTDWRVLFLPNTPPPPIGSWIVCVSNPHPHLVEQDAKVTGHGVDPSGSVLTVYAEPGPA